MPIQYAQAAHLSPPATFLGNGRPTVHGSLLEIGGGGVPNGCKCGGGAADTATMPRASNGNATALRSSLSPPPVSDRGGTTPEKQDPG